MTQPDEGPERIEGADRSHARDRRTGSSASAARIAQQHTWVDLQVRQAMERGEFDDLPGAGKPIEGLGAEHDPDWWLKKSLAVRMGANYRRPGASGYDGRLAQPDRRRHRSPRRGGRSSLRAARTAARCASRRAVRRSRHAATSASGSRGLVTTGGPPGLE